MDRNAKSILGWTSFAGALIASFMIWITIEQDAVSRSSTHIPTEEASMPTPTEEPVKIVFIDDIPTAVAFSATPTATQMPPTPTEKPQERISTPTPTNTPSPTPKPAKSAKNDIVPYPTGSVGTQYTDSKTAHQWKPYARYTAIMATGSREYALQQIARTDENGMRVVTDPNGVERYCIALAPQWAGGQSVDIGRCIDIKMANGTTLHCVLGDCKKHEHTQNKEGRYGSKGELIEFQVDMDRLPDKARNCGDVSYVGPEFEGGIVSVTVLDLYIDGFWR